jgi:tetraacyldisaccharide 4'-kinase
VTETPQAGGGKKTNRAEQSLLPIIQGKPGLVPSIVRACLTLLVPIYSVGLKLYLLPYAIGLRKRYRLKTPVVCVGNITTGGTGKTPMTQFLCRTLQARGLNVAVLSRGYGGANEYGCAIVSDGKEVKLTAAEAGDEPFLLATSLPGVPVLVGKDRRVTGALAETTFAPDLFVLDDGMQFWQLHRDMDLVLLNSVRPFDNGYPFPRGLLREPKSHIRRAAALILTGGEMAEPAQIDLAETQAKQIAPGKPVYRAGLRPMGLRPLTADGVKYRRTIEDLRGKPVATICALGNPASFEKTVHGIGAMPVHSVRFRDHAAVSAEELADAVDACIKAGAELIVTTEKDAARINFSSSTVPIFALQAEMYVERAEALISSIVQFVRAGSA